MARLSSARIQSFPTKFRVLQSRLLGMTAAAIFTTLPHAWAEPVRIASTETVLLTGSSLDLRPLFPVAWVHFVSNDWRFDSYLDREESADTIFTSGPLMANITRTQGQMVDLSSHVMLSNAQMSNVPLFLANLTFETGQTTLVGPDESGDFTGKDAVRFNMVGTFVLFDVNGIAIETRDLRGAGWASLSPFYGSDPLVVNYSFTSAEPVPEPATLLLLGAGTLVFARRRVRYRPSCE